MDVIVQARNVEVPESLRAAAKEKLAKLSRHLDGWEHAEVHFSEERNPRIADKEVCEVTLWGHGHVVRAKAASPDALSALDRVMVKLEHQVAKLKTRLTNRSHPRRQSVDSRAPGGQAVPGDQDDGDEDPDDLRIVKVKRFSMKPMTPEEAALQLDMSGNEFHFFSNADTGTPAVIYRRSDGDLGLIESS